VELISIIRSGRSESTLLEGLRHSGTKVAALREVSKLWKKGVLRNALGGRRRPFSICAFRKEVLSSAFDSPARRDAQQVDRQTRRALTPIQQRGLERAARILLEKRAHPELSPAHPQRTA
jgi:hypothetical protein